MRLARRSLITVLSVLFVFSMLPVYALGDPLGDPQPADQVGAEIMNQIEEPDNTAWEDVGADANDDTGTVDDTVQFTTLKEASDAGVVAPVPENKESYVQDEIIIVFGTQADTSQEVTYVENAIDDASANDNQTEAEVFSTLRNGSDTVLVNLPEDVSVEEALLIASNQENVVFALPNYLGRYEDNYIPQTTINDPYGQWQLESVSAFGAWDLQRVEGSVTIAIMDTGVDMAHSDLRNNVLEAEAWDVVNQQPLSVSVATGQVGNNGDYQIHGTFVAGLAAAEANNSIGTAGTSYNAKILPISIGNDVTTSNVIAACDKVLEISENRPDLRIRIVNMSFGFNIGPQGGEFFNQYPDIFPMYDRVKALEEAGILVVAGAGNDGDDTDYYEDGTSNNYFIYPSDFPEVLSVTALDEYDTIASFSSHNKYKNVSAPGDGVYSAFTIDESFTPQISGTSFSSPMVAGIAALMFAADNTLTPLQAREILQETAVDLGDPGFDYYYGWGKVDAYAAVKKVQELNAPRCEVTFDYNYPEGPAPVTVSVVQGATLGSSMPADPERLGYIFCCWKADEENDFVEIDEDTIITSDITVYALWVETEVVTVTFDYNYLGGPVSYSISMNRDSHLGTLLPVNIIREGYIFNGWNTEADGSGDYISHTMGFSESQTLYGIWVDSTNWPQIIALDSCGKHTISVLSDGTVWSWGENNYGLFVDGTTVDKNVPVQAIGLSDAIAVSTGQDHSLALKSDGTVWAWGDNGWGQLGNGTDLDSYIPVQVPGLSDVVAIAAGSRFSLALKSDGTVWAWGLNEWGQLGDGTLTDSCTPVQVIGLTNVTSIAASEMHSVAVKDNGTVWVWGDNHYGELGVDDWQQGNPLLMYSETPIQVIGIADVVSISTGMMHTLALKSDGTVWGWGRDGGVCIYGTYPGDDSNTPVQIPGLSNVRSIAAGQDHGLAIRDDSTVWGWGYNEAGQTGCGTTDFGFILTPVPIYGLENAVLIAGGDFHSVVVKADGTAWAFGLNASGQIGDASNAFLRLPPVLVRFDLGISASAAVTFNYNYPEGPAPVTLNVTRGTTLGSSMPTDPARLGYRFDGWLTDEEHGYMDIDADTVITTDVTVYAQWSEVDIITITFDYNYPAAPAPYSVIINRDSPLGNLLPVNLIREGYIFNGWNTEPDGSDDYISHAMRINESQTLYGIWVDSTNWPKIIAVDTCFRHSVATSSDGTVWAWGQNGSGQLGDGTTVDKNAPVQVIGLSDVIAVAAGWTHSLALKSDGTVWAWGDNYRGMLGDGTDTDSLTPVQVTGLSDVVAIAANMYNSYALKSDGTVWAWGNNGWGQLGDGTLTDSFAPVQVIGLTNATSIATGYYHAVAVKDDGTVWAWGDNVFAQLGIGDWQQGDLSLMYSDTPVQVIGITDAASVTAGAMHTLVLKSDGTVWGWGSDGGSYVFGKEYEGACYTPVQIPGLTDVVTIASGEEHVLAIKADGTLWGWGYNEGCQTGCGTTDIAFVKVPAPIYGIEDAMLIAGGDYHSIVVKADGTAWAFGLNASGQIGDASKAFLRLPPVLVRFDLPADTTVVVTFDYNYTDSPATFTGIVEQGTSFGLNMPANPSRIGYDFAGWYKTTSGNGTDFNADSIVNYDMTVYAKWTVKQSVTYVMASAGDFHTTALKSDGTVWTWGRNNYGQLGDGTTVNNSAPSQVAGLTNVIAVASGSTYSLALKADGTVWAWGQNNYGQLGDGTTTLRNTPVKVSGLTDVVSISAGTSHSLAVKADGTVWAWGLNTYGRLGDGTTTNRNTPVQVNGLSNVASVSAGDAHSLAVKKDGTVWAWGLNTYSRLGDGTTTNRTTPVQLMSISGVASVSAGTTHSLAVKTDGTVWAWGQNTNSRLGDGTTTTRSTPVQVSGLTNVSSVSAGDAHSLAVKSDGTVWAWGLNTYGRLGDGTTTTRTTPIQVMSISGVSSASAGATHSLAVKTDGTLWAWGQNNYGQLGDGTTTNRTAPTQMVFN